MPTLQLINKRTIDLALKISCHLIILFVYFAEFIWRMKNYANSTVVT